MKTSQDFNNNFEQYNAYIEKEIANLNRMREEIQANGAVAQQIINDLEPVLEKLHLKIEEFTMNQPNKEVASNKGGIWLRLLSDGKFKFIKFALVILHVVLVRMKDAWTVRLKRWLIQLSRPWEAPIRISIAM